MLSCKRARLGFSMMLMMAALLAGGIVADRANSAQDDGEGGGGRRGSGRGEPEKAPPPGQEVLEGIVSDAMCGATHKSKIAVQCLKTCVDKGSNYALIVDDKVYELIAQDPERAKLADLANVRAKVTGKINGMKIEVTSVAEPKFTNPGGGG